MKPLALTLLLIVIILLRHEPKGTVLVEGVVKRDTVWMATGLGVTIDTVNRTINPDTVFIQVPAPPKSKRKAKRPLEHFFPKGDYLENQQCDSSCNTNWLKTI